MNERERKKKLSIPWCRLEFLRTHPECFHELETEVVSWKVKYGGYDGVMVIDFGEGDDRGFDGGPVKGHRWWIDGGLGSEGALPYFVVKEIALTKVKKRAMEQ
ncbi:hypothetical protein VNO78_23883 [Psophocarpus tetragonolobus]|uniref:Uncharacterized protein n=1 Tax=Psophocarpus tetragonolobus TaxID=3891 RepID=A0AAN9S5K9_PSOTE